MSADPAKSRQAREILDRQVQHMARLIEDLLDQSRINRGLVELRPERVSLALLMEQAVEATRPAIEAARHRFELHLPVPDMALDADPARLVQVIGNLLNNAAKYTPDGGDIRLSAWQAGERAVLEVVDNGVGIPPDQQGRLFQMFTQLHHSAHRAQGGLGIGLSLVRSLVQMHGGQVRVASDGLDAGSTFTVELPLPADTLATPVQASAPAAGSVPAGRRILVVEDNPDGLESLVALLELLGYVVATAGDGRTALAVAAQFAPELVLLDLGLPEMDGYEVARALRGDPRHAAVVLVALTGWGAEQDRVHTAEAGFDHHLTKPVDPDRLQAFLDDAFLGLAPSTGPR
jgi:CheY-like chemotaxis protein/two-component sensor histidine kinase